MDPALLIAVLAGVLGASYVVIGRWRRRLPWLIGGLGLVSAPLLLLPRLGIPACLAVLAAIAGVPPLVELLGRRRG